MRKLQIFGLTALLAVALVAAPAGAFTWGSGAGDHLGKMADWGSFYSPDGQGGATPNAVGDFEEGDWDQTLFRISELYSPPIEIISNRYYSGIPELIGLLYDLKAGTITVLRAPGTNDAADPGKFEIDLISAGRYTTSTDAVASVYTGGRVDLWEDGALDFTPAGSGGYPADWGYGAPGAAGWDADPFGAGEYDTFPTTTDGTAVPILSGTLLPYDPDNKPGVLITLTLDFDDGTGVSTQGFIKLTYDVTSPQIIPVWLGGTAHIAFFNNFKFYPNVTIPYEPVFDDPRTDTIYWDTSSQDPMNFTTIPEPATMSLLGMALIGLGGSVLRKRKK